MPPNTVFVGRPSKYSNPFRVEDYTNHARLPQVVLHRFATDDFKEALLGGNLAYTVDDIKKDLRGKNLACWCREDHACHADVLLELANT